jgi:NAD-dependent dihydropyrimidine dehydrogenase PreA subunit
MPATLAKAPAVPRDYAACSGCSLCLLVCPMWRRHHDPRLTPEGMTKALQCGATVAHLQEPAETCSLCGACDPVCPERIDLSGMVMELRHQLTSALPPHVPPRVPRPAVLDDLQVRLQKKATPANPANAAKPAGPSQVSLRSDTVFLPGPALRADPAFLARIVALLNLPVFDDDGDDIALALELGADIPQARLQSFIDSLRGHSIVAADGLLLRQLRRWLPGSKRMGLGAALCSRAAVRSNLAATDLYVIEPRACHADYERMVIYYNNLQIETGCRLSLDLQRIAIPASAPGLLHALGVAVNDDDTQTKWILQGRKPERIVVEDQADIAAFRRITDIPVVHLAELGGDPTMIRNTARAFN